MQSLYTLLFHPSAGQSWRTVRDEDDAALQQVRAEAQRREAALVERMRADDPAAFAAIMELYTARLIRLAHSLVGSRDVAEDVVQSTFIQIWERREHVDPARPLKPYLFRAVRNRALKETRAASVRERYRVHVQAEATAETGVGYMPSSESEILTAAEVESALSHLSERRRFVLRLRFEEEMSHTEIAEVMGISAMAAQRTVARAVAELRALLGNI